MMHLLDFANMEDLDFGEVFLEKEAANNMVPKAVAFTQHLLECLKKFKKQRMVHS
jgi:hypothetical protein